MILIYVAADKQKQAIDQINPADTFACFRTNDKALVHYANKVYVVGKHPEIEDRYAGITNVEQVTLKSTDNGDS